MFETFVCRLLSYCCYDFTWWLITSWRKKFMWSIIHYLCYRASLIGNLTRPSCGRIIISAQFSSRQRVLYNEKNTRKLLRRFSLIIFSCFFKQNTRPVFPVNFSVNGVRLARSKDSFRSLLLDDKRNHF